MYIIPVRVLYIYTYKDSGCGGVAMLEHAYKKQKEIKAYIHRNIFFIKLLLLLPLTIIIYSHTTFYTPTDIIIILTTLPILIIFTLHSYKYLL